MSEQLQIKCYVYKEKERSRWIGICRDSRYLTVESYDPEGAFKAIQAAVLRDLANSIEDSNILVQHQFDSLITVAIISEEEAQRIFKLSMPEETDPMV